MKTFTSLLFIILSIVGIADSGFITYEKISGVVPSCGAGFDCSAVLTSKWASIGPIPLSALGFLYYAIVFILGILLFVEFDVQTVVKKYFKISKNNILSHVTTSELLLLVTAFGFLFSIYLVSIMAFIIGEWCNFCLISATTSTALFFTAVFYFIQIEKRSPYIPKYLIFNCMYLGYTRIVKPLFFLSDAETAHNSCTALGKFLGKFSIAQLKTRVLFSFTHPNNRKIIDGIEFPNQVGLAAGFDYNAELCSILPHLGMGWHTIGTVTYHPYEGNKKPRLGRFLDSKSLLVNKGLKSLGAKAIAKKLSGYNFTIPTGISIASTNMHFNSDEEQILDILQTFIIFEKSNVQHKYYELNISCPNTFGGEPFTTPQRLQVLLDALSRLQKQIHLVRPIYVKMPIDQSSKETLALLNVLDKHKCISGVIFGNLTKDKNNPDVTEKDKKQWAQVKGNLSGKPTWNRSNALIELTRKNYKNRFTIIGTGGIFTGADALIKIEKGADLIQVITGMIFVGPQTIGEMNMRLAQKNSEE